MSASYRLADGRTLTVQTNMVETTSDLPRPDPDWSYTDQQGHEHRYVDGRLPTLHWAVDEEDYTVVEDDGYPEEYPGSGHYECATCGEHVSPATTPAPPWREYIAGSRSYTLDGEPIAEDEAQALIEARPPRP